MQRAVNPETGEVVFLVDNQWVAPSQTAENKYGDKAFLVNNQWIQPPTQKGVATEKEVAAPAPAAPQENRGILGKAVDYIKEQGDLLAGDLYIGGQNFSIGNKQNQIAGMEEIQQARKLKYPNPADMPPELKADFDKTQQAIQEKLNAIEDNKVKIKNAEKEYGVRSSTENFNKLTSTPEYQDGSFFDKAAMIGGAFIKDPIGIATDIAVQNGPASAPILVSAALARLGGLNPTVTAGAAGTTSAMTQFGSEYSNLRDQGMSHKDAWENAGVKSGVVGLFDALSFKSAGNAAGKIFDDMAKTALTKTAKDVVGEVAKQGAYGAAGEGVGAYVTNQPVDPMAMAQEAIGEIIGAPMEAVTTYQGHRAQQVAQNAPAVAAQSVPDNIPPSQMPAAVLEEPKPVKNQEEASQDFEAMLRELTGEEPVQMDKSEVPVESKAVEPEEVKTEAVIQNRNRATPASVQQMNNIANKLDYDLVKSSPTLSDGAPVVAGNVQIPEAQFGKQDIVTASDGTKIPVQYAVVSANEVLPSNNVDGSLNKQFFDPNYVGLKAIAGNARTAGIQAAFDRGNANDYASRLIADEAHGISPQVVASVPNPMLVRLMPPEYVTDNIGDISNVASNLDLSAVEQAKNDAARVDMRGLNFDQDGNIGLDAMRGFIASMPTTEQGRLIDSNGLPTRQARERMEAAIFSSAYGSDELVRLAHQAEDSEARNIIRAVSEAAPQMLRLQDAGQYDVRQQVVQAVEKAINARRSGVTLDEAARQTDMAMDPLANKIVEMFADNSRSAKAMANNLQSLANAAYEEAQTPEAGLFGETPKRAPAEIAETQLAKPEEKPTTRQTAVKESDVEKYKKFAEELMSKGKRTEDVNTVTKDGKEYDQWSVKVVSNLSKAQAEFWINNFGNAKSAVLVDEPRNNIKVALAESKGRAIASGRKYTMTWNATVEHVPADVRAAKMKEISSRMQEMNRSTERFPGANYDLSSEQIKDKYRMASLAQIDADIKRLDNSLAAVEKRKAQKVEELWRGTEFEGRIEKMLSDLRKAGADDFAAMLNIGINNDIRDGKLEDISFREESARKELARLGERKPIKYEPMTADKLANEIESLGSLPEEIQNAAVEKWNSIAPKLYEMGFRFRETRGIQDRIAQDLDKQLNDITAYVSDLAGRRYESAMLENRRFKTDDARIKAINNSEKQLAKAEVNATEAIGFETARHPGVDTSRPMDVYGSYVEQIKPESISFLEDKKFWDQAMARVTRDEKIAEYAGLRRSKSAVEKRFVEDRSKPLDEDLYKRIHERANILKKEIADTYTPDTSAENFMANATRALANEAISREVYDAINLAFQKHPNLLDGLRLSVRQTKRGEASREAAGNFDPFERIVTLFKFTNGTENPSTIRHELTHGMEQMMPEAARLKVVDAWATALEKAVKAEKTKAGKEFFSKVEEFIAKPSKESLRDAIKVMPNMSYYQYVNPSEYWAVNAEKLLAANMGSAWQRFKSAIKMWYQGLRKVFGASNTWVVNRVFRDIINNERVTSAMLNDYVSMAVDLDSFSRRRNYAGKDAPLAGWDSPDESKLDTIIYNLQNKHIDTKRVIEQIEKKTGQLEEDWNPYLKEELYHGRTAERTSAFLRKDILPILKEMKRNDITAQQFDDFLHNRHAEERNVQIAKINPEMQDGGSGIDTEDASRYLADIPADRRKVLDALADKVDAIVRGTQEVLVKNGLEERSTINAWNKTYKHYVPLQRDDIEFVQPGGSSGMGQGFGTRGSSVKRAVGSEKTVVDVFANIAAQREKAIVRAEKARVGRALYGLAIKNPNPEFWLPVNPDAVKNKGKLKKELESMGLDAEDAENLIEEPKHPEIDPKTGLVQYKIRSYLRNSENVFPVRVNGKDRFIFFNSSDPRAMRMVESLKNLDAEQLGVALGTIGGVTRWIASVNTQYNPVFGAWNFARDLEGSAMNISTTEIAGKEKSVVAGVLPALKGIWSYMRDEREGKEPTGDIADLIRSYREHGGQTGYRDQFTKNREEANLIEREMGKLGRGNANKAFHYFAGLLSDYNDSMENAVRISAYKVALDSGLSEDKAASIAKNLTVNFNRKGKMGPTLGALYAFFNASMQGTARIYETLTGPMGRKIVAGGLALGVLQSMMLAAAGMEGDDPPEFTKEKNFIIPIGGGKYIMIPLPLGYNAIPTVGRLAMDMVISGGKQPAKKIIDMLGAVTDAFNPLGSSGLALTMSPTVADPFLSAWANRDAFGRPIYREDRATNPSPGYTRSRESTLQLSRWIAEFLNFASGGTKYQKGSISPTADYIEYLAGQFTGGVGREALKAAATIKSGITGEELPPYKIPVVGKILGDTSSTSNISNQFYQNVTQLAQMEHEIKGRREHREDVRGFLEKHPEARLWETANQLENQVSALNRERKDLMAKGAPKDRIKRIEDQKTRMMDQFNKRYNSLVK